VHSFLYVILFIRCLFNNDFSKSYSVVFNGRIEISNELEDILNVTVVKELEALTRNSFENNGDLKLKRNTSCNGVEAHWVVRRQGFHIF
jgi:hypothetical protein